MHVRQLPQPVPSSPQVLAGVVMTILSIVIGGTITLRSWKQQIVED